MADFVAYHKIDEYGEYQSGGGSFSHFSSHPKRRLENTIGETLWVISGERINGTMSYHLCARYSPTKILARGAAHSVVGEGTEFTPHIAIQNDSWFSALLKEQGHFRYGLNRIKDPKIVLGLQILESGGSPLVHPDEIPDVEMYQEGAKYRVTVNAYERDPNARRKCIEHFGCRCSICGFDFAAQYGELGMGIIHVHHLRELSRIGIRYRVNPTKDLLPVCPNCHAVIHASGDPLDPERVRDSLTYVFKNGRPTRKGK